MLEKSEKLVSAEEMANLGREERWDHVGHQVLQDRLDQEVIMVCLETMALLAIKVFQELLVNPANQVSQEHVEPWALLGHQGRLETRVRRDSREIADLEDDQEDPET